VAREYKRKRLAEEWATDEKPTDIRKSLNASERQRGKSLAVSGLKDHEDTLDKDLIKNLRWNLEEKLSSECYQKEILDPAHLLNETLLKLGIGKFELYKLHKCDCPDPINYSDEEILRLSGY
jgi:hypothetical protein